MSDALYHQARYLRGGSQPRLVAGTVAAEIKAGDLVVLITSKAIRASSLADVGSKAQNQTAAHAVFLGSALSGKLAGQTANILVQADGEHCYPCAALGQAYDVGQYIGFQGTGAAGAVGVADQAVEPVATAGLAIGRLTRPAASGDTQVYFELAGVLTTTYAGPQAAV